MASSAPLLESAGMHLFSRVPSSLHVCCVFSCPPPFLLNGDLLPFDCPVDPYKAVETTAGRLQQIEG
jgi:hypothetical protein